MNESYYIDFSLQYFVEAGAMAVRRCKKADLKRIAKATGAAFVTSLSNMEGVYQRVLYLAQCSDSCGRCILQCSMLGTLLFFSWKVHIEVFYAWHTAVIFMACAYCSVLCLAHCCFFMEVAY